MFKLVKLVESEKITSESAPVPRLETSRLWLRPWKSCDVEGYAQIMRDPEVMRYMGCGLKYKTKRAIASILGLVSDVETRLKIRRLISHWQTCGFGEWAVEEKGTGQLIGQIGLTHHPDWTADPANIEVGWLLARRAWGKGYATEGAIASLSYAFDHLKLDRIVSIAMPENLRSQRVMQRIGLTHVGGTRWKGCEVLWWGMDHLTWKHRLDGVIP